MSFWNSLTYAERNRWDNMSPKAQEMKRVAWRLRSARARLLSAQREMKKATETYNELTGFHLPVLGEN